MPVPPGAEMEQNRIADLIEATLVLIHKGSEEAVINSQMQQVIKNINEYLAKYMLTGKPKFFIQDAIKQYALTRYTRTELLQKLSELMQTNHDHDHGHALIRNETSTYRCRL